MVQRLVMLQEVYDSLKGGGLGDELYVEGMDDAFLEWRAQHGQEWARYYGLAVSPLLNTPPAASRCGLQESQPELLQHFPLCLKAPDCPSFSTQMAGSPWIAMHKV